MNAKTPKGESPHLSESELEELRGALEAEKDSVEEELADHGRQVNDEGDWEGSSGSFGEEADPNDVADNIEELATNLPLVEELQTRHKEIVHALGAMDAGTYGICEVCNEPIPMDRLEANPAARTCIRHTL